MNFDDSAPFLHFDLVSANAIDALDEDDVLGLHCLGNAAPFTASRWPIQRVAMPILPGDNNLLYEVWRTHKPCRSGQFRDIHFRATDDALFGVIELDESELEPNAGESALRAAAKIAYEQIFSLLQAQGFEHLWRVWNYLPDIHADECDLERYRQFNIGRHQAFAAYDKSVDNSPAASALGVMGSLFSVAFIAGRAASRRIENPRQVSAFAYPVEYGPRSPTFTRAATVIDGGYEALFISGTASIVGHETLHRDDVAAQTKETIANLAALLREANAQTRTPLYTLQNLVYRVYIRHADDFARVKQTLHAMIGSSMRATYLQAEICRRDLLVEIEAFAIKPLPMNK
jgi:enamine deaminase RidA (YjgF/YER057c/UK114 family)